MNKLVLLLRLEGPLQSWGTKSRWDARDTGDEPTKSGVIGLLGCAMGLVRGHPTLLELDQKLCYGVRVENAGRKVTDYQTITDYLPAADGGLRFSGGTQTSKLSADQLRKTDKLPTTIISPRDYLEDAAFLVGLQARVGAEALLQEAKEAVQAPHWPLFLGRKACVPVRPVYEAFTSDYADLEAALTQYKWEWLGVARESQAGVFENSRRSKPTRRLNGWIEPHDATVPGTVSRQDALQLNAARVFGFRLAAPFSVVPETLDLSNGNEVQQ